MLTKDKKDISPLLATLNQLHPLSNEITNFLTDKISSRNFRKGAMLLKEGNVCESIYFIKRGAIRGFIKDGSRDITTWISAENEIVTSIAGLNQRAPSAENIQTVEFCETLMLSYSHLQELYQNYIEFNINGRKLLEMYYQDAENRAYVSRITGTEQKYRYFLKRYPHLVNRIPIKYIASFLGVTLETLSRTRKKFAE
ncbi:Crp/Fnr family transcriptional regulator [Pollutibacter soli]|uniref:Crp/Fnr family transcriptional regulator n=1 Tax=Pollutibacter soli TaxID=3034157 RepID=UPI0030132EE6